MPAGRTALITGVSMSTRITAVQQAADAVLGASLPVMPSPPVGADPHRAVGICVTVRRRRPAETSGC